MTEGQRGWRGELEVRPAAPLALNALQSHVPSRQELSGGSVPCRQGGLAGESRAALPPAVRLLPVRLGPTATEDLCVSLPTCGCQCTHIRAKVLPPPWVCRQAACTAGVKQAAPPCAGVRRSRCRPGSRQHPEATESACVLQGVCACARVCVCVCSHK